jgi:hypothetical protein
MNTNENLNNKLSLKLKPLSGLIINESGELDILVGAGLKKNAITGALELDPEAITFKHVPPTLGA